MSNTPPIPDDLSPPWPAQPGPVALPHADETVADVKAKGKAKGKRKIAKEAEAASKANARKIAGVGAAIGIGSAAIVAALMYANRNSGKK